MFTKKLSLISLFLVLAISLVQSQKKQCLLNCSTQPKEPVCGSNDKTYDSFCELQKASSCDGEDVAFVCNGQCPCDPSEVVQWDSDTVHKIQKARTLFQLRKHEDEELNKSEDYLALSMADNDEAEFREHLIKEAQRKAQKPTVQEEKKECSAHELGELPNRLIDWFHVLRINQKVQEMKDQGIEQEPVMNAEKFTDEKIRAMYSQLACTQQKGKEIEKAVCLKPVRWMFEHLDGNQDGSLDTDELSEIESIQNEHCIRPFLQSCDLDQDGKVEMSEFCRCLCATPPCTKLIKDIPILMLRGVPTPMPGFFVPSCDDDGFFMPEQCNPKKQCWCVDRNGGELVGTRKNKGGASCNAYNTANPPGRLIPLDVKKENGGIKKEIPAEKA